MLNQISSPVEIFSRELHRLNNDVDRLQMLMTLKSRLYRLRIDFQTLQTFCSLFHDEQYRLQAIGQLIHSIHPIITSDSLTSLFELFTTTENRFHLLEILKNSEPLNINKEVHSILLQQYRQYFHVRKIPSKQLLNLSKDPPALEPNIPVSTSSSNVAKVLSSTSGVFEKAKQFVCRVFGGGGTSSSSSSSLSEDPSNKRLTSKVESLTDVTKAKKFRSVDELQFQPTSLPISISHSYTSVISKSPPPSPVTCSPEQPITRQSSMSFQIDPSTVPIQSMMVTQIHSILDNIDSVLDKIEAQASTASRRSAFNENYPHIERATSPHLHIDPSDELPNTTVQQSTDQITQTTMNFVERHLNITDGSGDTTPAFLDLLDIEEDSHSSVLSEESESSMDSFQ